MNEHKKNKNHRVGRISFWLALSPWIAYGLYMVCAFSGLPGFG